MEFEEFEVGLTPDLAESFDYDTDAILDDIAESVLPAQQATPPPASESVDGEFEMMSTRNYRARVWAGIPAIGWSYINQEFRANVSGGRITSFQFLGSSYASGLSIGNLTHQRSWRSTSGRVLEIHMRGTLNYVWQGVTLGGAQTFLDSWCINNSSLTSKTTLNC